MSGIYVSARSFAEYQSMFTLSEQDLSLRILDCPGGAASFVAEAATRGADVVAVDPQYGARREELGALALREIEHKHADLVQRAADFEWTWFDGPEQYTRLRSESARLFGTDIGARPERYVAGCLPDLPFPDRSFDLVLSSHLLFSYGAQLDESFHRDSLLELVRVSRWQVRLYPLYLHTGHDRYPALDRMRKMLSEFGVPSRLARVDYAFAPGVKEVLILESAEHGALPKNGHGPRSDTGSHDPVRWRHLDPPS